MGRRPKAGAAAESAVPAGLAHLELFPALKRRAIIVRPSGPAGLYADEQIAETANEAL